MRASGVRDNGRNDSFNSHRRGKIVKKISLAACALGVCLTGVDARAQGGPAAPQIQWGTGKAEIPLGEVTEVRGAKVKPELAGTWITIENAEIGGGRYYGGAIAYRISREGEKLSVNKLDLTLPPEIEKALSERRAAGAKWEPSKEEIAALGKAPRQTPAKIRARHVLASADGFDAAEKEASADMNATMLLSSVFQPEKNPVYGTAYYVASASAGEMKGRFITGAVASNVKGVPLPISVQGDFLMLRVKEAAPEKAAAVNAPAKN